MFGMKADVPKHKPAFAWTLVMPSDWQCDWAYIVGLWDIKRDCMNHFTIRNKIRGSLDFGVYRGIE